jgi:hypothetical protein
MSSAVIFADGGFAMWSVMLLPPSWLLNRTLKFIA